jgi:hypothetical protein
MATIRNLTAMRYMAGNVVFSVISANAVQIAFSDDKIQFGSLRADTDYGSKFLYTDGGKTVRTKVLQTVAQVKASFSIT